MDTSTLDQSPGGVYQQKGNAESASLDLDHLKLRLMYGTSPLQPDFKGLAEF